MTLAYFTLTGAAYDENTKTNSSRHKCSRIVGQKYQAFREFRTPFSPRDIRKNPPNMYARVPHTQFVLKIEKLSHIIGTAPILEMARTYGLGPRLWLLGRSSNMAAPY